MVQDVLVCPLGHRTTALDSWRWEGTAGFREKAGVDMVGGIMIGGQCNNFQKRHDGVAKEWTL